MRREYLAGRTDSPPRLRERSTSAVVRRLRDRRCGRSLVRSLVSLGCVIDDVRTSVSAAMQLRPGGVLHGVTEC